MPDACEQITPIYSTFGDDPDLGELVEMFVDEMPDRIGNLQAQYDAKNWEELGRAAHQMKGAAGSYGFNDLTPIAAQLEATVHGNEAEDKILADLNSLVDICSRIRAGAPE